MNPQTVADWLIFNGAIVAIVCTPLALWDNRKRIGRLIRRVLRWAFGPVLRWAEDRVARDVAAALRQPLDRQPSSLDVTADRHEAYPTHTWRTK